MLCAGFSARAQRLGRLPPYTYQENLWHTHYYRTTRCDNALIYT